MRLVLKVLALSLLWPVAVFAGGGESHASHLKFNCLRENRRSTSLLDGFELEILSSKAQITIERRQKITSYHGTSDLKAHPASGRNWFLYKGFNELLGEYDSSLLVSQSIQLGKTDEVRLQGKGDSYIFEDYICR